MRSGMSFVIIIKTCLRIIEAGFLFVIAYIMSTIMAYIQNDNVFEIFGLAAIFLVNVVVYHAVSIVLKNKSEKMAETQEQAFRERVYLGVLKNKTAYIEKIGMAGIKLRLENYFPTVASFYKNTLPDIFSGLLIGVVYMIVFIVYDPVLASIFAALSLIQVIPSIIVKNFVRRDYEAINNEGLRWFNFVLEAFRGLLTIKSFNLKSWYTNKLENINRDQIRVYTRHFKRVGQEEALNKSANSIVVYGVYALIGFFVLYRGVYLDVAVIFVVLSGNFFGTTSRMYTSLPRYFEFSKAKPLIAEVVGYSPKETFAGSPNSDNILYKADNISFSYDTNDSVGDFILKNFSASVIKGEKIALVGPNGKGKSTFVKLLLNHYDDYTGTIKLNGEDVKKYSDEDINRLVSYLPQNDALLHMPIEEALGFFENSHEIKQTAELLGFDFEQKQTIDTLSGGERKKLLLSICLTREAECIILDEPTNSLDDDSEKKLLGIIAKCNKTMIIATHNADLIACCNRTIAFGGKDE
ncbi:MAG: ATP-binding cassette domain-containing protein [Defluviitaleaceae bacterium]|nr:ATP-binding cassette domain-containing protein [Defluviitaleaceae bacterium]